MTSDTKNTGEKHTPGAAHEWPADVALPNGGLLFMEGNITSDTHPFSVVALRPDKTVLWERCYANFRTARRHFDRCVAGIATPTEARATGAA